MRILLTNDDGIRAPGILALFDAIADTRSVFGGPLMNAAEIVPVAPLTVQSATSHGVTFHEPLMVEAVKVPTPAGGVMDGTAVDGRPADCVKLALSTLWPERFGAGTRPDLVISGMNAGANCGINVIYSGTVAAALEGAFLGVPSIAVSLHLGRGTARFDLAAARARKALEAVLAGGLPEDHACLSINIPRTEVPSEAGLPSEPPIHVCAMNTHGLVDKFERRSSPGGAPYYWASGHGLDFHATDPGSDVDLLMKGCITVTPLAYDLTKHAMLDRWRQRVERQTGRGL
jgi:5'-nucleotidase